MRFFVLLRPIGGSIVMPDNSPTYEFTTVQSFRGREDATIKKWTSMGWELVEQDQGMLRSSLKFRREKTQLSRRTIILISYGVLTAIAAMGMVAALNLNDKPTTIATTPTSEATSAEAPPIISEDVISTETLKDEPLTAVNNAELSRLLKAPNECDESFKYFAENHQGKEIQFDGYIAKITHHENHKTRYDILILSGEPTKQGATGPYFQIRDVNLVSDIGLTGDNIPEHLAEQQAIRLRAKIDTYHSPSCLFLLNPISTEIR